MKIISRKEAFINSKLQKLSEYELRHFEESMKLIDKLSKLGLKEAHIVVPNLKKGISEFKHIIDIYLMLGYSVKESESIYCICVYWD